MSRFASAAILTAAVGVMAGVGIHDLMTSQRAGVSIYCATDTAETLVIDAARSAELSPTGTWTVRTEAMTYYYRTRPGELCAVSRVEDVP